MKFSELKTPCALVDLDRFEGNCARMADRAHALGVRLRPHVKTHKCVEAARIQTRDHFGGITVSTLAEARGFADGAFRDITYAVPVPLDRLDECATLARRLDRFHLVLDHETTLAALEESAAAHGIRFSVFLKVDCGLHRAGVDPARDESIALARHIHVSDHVGLTGILTHAGHSYASRSADQSRTVARQERDVVDRTAPDGHLEGVEEGVVAGPDLGDAGKVVGGRRGGGRADADLGNGDPRCPEALAELHHHIALLPCDHA